jgi:hypothetical protein
MDSDEADDETDGQATLEAGAVASVRPRASLSRVGGHARPDTTAEAEQKRRRALAIELFGDAGAVMDLPESQPATFKKGVSGVGVRMKLMRFLLLIRV